MGTNILNTEILNDTSKNQFDVDQVGDGGGEGCTPHILT